MNLARAQPRAAALTGGSTSGAGGVETAQPKPPFTHPAATRGREHEMFIATDTTYETANAALVLRESAYRLMPGDAAVATIPDDGIIDLVAVTAWTTGGGRPRITPREVVCVVAELAGRGLSDAGIAAACGRPDEQGRKWVTSVRRSNRIAAAEPTYDADELARMITDVSARNRASDHKREAAGLALPAAA